MAFFKRLGRSFLKFIDPAPISKKVPALIKPYKLKKLKK